MGIIHIIFIWEMFHINLDKSIGLKEDVTYIYAYEDALDIALPKGDFYLYTEEGDCIKLYEI